MTGKKLIDSNGIEFKYVEIDQFDGYDFDHMEKQKEKYDKRIGSLLISFSELEQTLDKAISFLISDRSDDDGYRITMDLSFNQKVQLFNRLCKTYFVYNPKKGIKEKLKNLIEQLISAARIRNIVAHAKWMSLDKDGFVRSRVGMDDEAQIQFKYYKLTPSELYRLERKIIKTDNDFYEFLEKNNLI